MAIIQGIPSKVIDTITRKLGLQTAVDRSTFDLINSIQPIVIADEKTLEIIKTSAVSGTLYTTPSKGDFYLTDIYCNGTYNDDTCSTNTMSVTLETGETIVLLRLSGGATAAAFDNNSTNLNFSHPIKLKKGSNITTVKASALANFGIMGYILN